VRKQKIPVRESRTRRENIIKIDVQEIECEFAGRIQVARERVKWLAFVNKFIFGFLKKSGRAFVLTVFSQLTRIKGTLHLSLKGRLFLNQISDYQLLKNNSVSKASVIKTLNF
jgi:hypothetical protein